MPRQAGMLSGPTDDTAAWHKQNLRSPWHSCDSQRNIGHDGRFSALGARPAGLRTTITRALREAFLDTQAPLPMLATGSSFPAKFPRGARSVFKASSYHP
jgi:hypothetical protein